MTTQAYHTASRELLAQGLGELERGDARQASGTGWDAAAQMVKAIAEARGWPTRQPSRPLRGCQQARG